MSKLALALHGGAGTVSRITTDAAAELPYRKALKQALDLGWQALESGAPALDAVAIVVASLEDCPLFNAGRGSVLTHEGKVEMDAAVMCGRTLKAGAVAAVPHVRNPVHLARAVLDDGRFVLLVGKGGLQFAERLGLSMESLDYFITAEREAQLVAAKAASRVTLDHEKFGTVGAVALDINGDLAAATSTGGLTNKTFSRVGDSPLIGAGTYADNRACAVSCTGYGEAFIRAVVAYDVAARIVYGGASLCEASSAVVHDALPKIDGQGGLIAVDRTGKVVLPFNTEGMYRAWRTSADGESVDIY